jgi:hypothetical protein
MVSTLGTKRTEKNEREKYRNIFMNEIKNHKSDGEKLFGKWGKKEFALIDESDLEIQLVRLNSSDSFVLILCA